MRRITVNSLSLHGINTRTKSELFCSPTATFSEVTSEAIKFIKMTELQPIVVTKVEIQKPTYYAKVNSWLKDFTGYDLKSVSSLDNIIKLLHSPRDGSSLAVARIFYGEHQVTNLLFYSIMVN